jgi:hypothetical protein
MPRLPRKRRLLESPRNDQEKPFARVGYEQFPSMRGLCESEAFLWLALGGAVFENSAACVYVET